MIIWDDPDKRYYQHGLDQGVLYPSKLPEQLLRGTNYIYNPRAAVDAALWTTYGTATVVARVIDGGSPAFQISKSAAGSQIGMRTANPGGMTSRPAGTQVTISALVKNPTGQVITTFGFIARDDTNNDSAVLSTITAGAMSNAVPADNAWHRIFVTGTVVAGRNLQGVYIQKSGTPLITEKFLVKDIMLNDGPLMDFFDGSTPEDLNSYEWNGGVASSTSSSYVISGRAFPWNGLISVDEGGEGSSEILYRDGVIYLADADAGDFQAAVTAIMYPDAFSDCLGIPKVADGLYADNQKPQRFSMSYRSLIGSGTRGDMFGYQIHLVYNAMASIGQRKRNTIGDNTSPVEFNFDLVCTPVKLAGYRPTAHFVIDTRNMSSDVIAAIEAILYGTATTVGRMPTPTELYDLMHFGPEMIFTVHTDGSYTVEGSGDNLEEIDINSFRMNNINAVDNGDGTYDVSTGGDTTVTIET